MSKRLKSLVALASLLPSIGYCEEVADGLIGLLFFSMV